MAAHRLAAQHALFGIGFSARHARIGCEFKGVNKTKNGILSVLDPVLRSFAPVEFSYGPLERKRAL